MARASDPSGAARRADAAVVPGLADPPRRSAPGAGDARRRCLGPGRDHLRADPDPDHRRPALHARPVPTSWTPPPACRWAWPTRCFVWLDEPEAFAAETQVYGDPHRDRDWRYHLRPLQADDRGVPGRRPRPVAGGRKVRRGRRLRDRRAGRYLRQRRPFEGACHGRDGLGVRSVGRRLLFPRPARPCRRSRACWPHRWTGACSSPARPVASRLLDRPWRLADGPTRLGGGRGDRGAGRLVLIASGLGLRLAASRSRISISSFSSPGVGAGGASGAGSAASARRMLLTSLTSRNTTAATIRNWIRVLMKAPYWMATFSIASVDRVFGLEHPFQLGEVQAAGQPGRSAA
jgi:hypothetical protein